MTPMYYYMWEFFTSMAIIIFVIAYIVYDRRQERIKAEKEAGVSDADTQISKNKASGRS